MDFWNAHTVPLRSCAPLRPYATFVLVLDVIDAGNGEVKDVAVSKLACNRGLAPRSSVELHHPTEAKAAFDVVLRQACFDTDHDRRFKVTHGDWLGMHGMYRGIELASASDWRDCVAWWDECMDALVNEMNVAANPLGFARTPMDDLHRPTVRVYACHQKRVGDVWKALSKTLPYWA